METNELTIPQRGIEVLTHLLVDFADGMEEMSVTVRIVDSTETLEEIEQELGADEVAMFREHFTAGPSRKLVVASLDILGRPLAKMALPYEDMRPCRAVMLVQEYLETIQQFMQGGRSNADWN